MVLLDTCKITYFVKWVFLDPFILYILGVYCPSTAPRSIYLVYSRSLLSKHCGYTHLSCIFQDFIVQVLGLDPFILYILGVYCPSTAARPIYLVYSRILLSKYCGQTHLSCIFQEFIVLALLLDPFILNILRVDSFILYILEVYCPSTAARPIYLEHSTRRLIYLVYSRILLSEHCRQTHLSCIFQEIIVQSLRLDPFILFILGVYCPSTAARPIYLVYSRNLLSEGIFLEDENCQEALEILQEFVKLKSNNNNIV